MGFFPSFGSGFDASSTDQTTNVTTTDVDETSSSLSRTRGIAAAGNKNKIRVREIDKDAVKLAFAGINESIDDALDFASDFAGNVLSFSGQTIGQVGAIAAPDVADEVTARARFQSAGQNDVIKFVAGAAAVSVVAWLFFRGRK